MEEWKGPERMAGDSGCDLTAMLRGDADSGELCGGQTPCTVLRSLLPGSTRWSRGAPLDGHSAPPHPSHHALSCVLGHSPQGAAALGGTRAVAGRLQGHRSR